MADERRVFLSTLPAGRGERRLALAVVLVSAVVFITAAPFAKVSKRLVEAMGGTIVVESRLGAGTTFITTGQTEARGSQLHDSSYPGLGTRLGCSGSRVTTTTATCVGRELGA